MFTPILETERLILRQIETEDVDAIFNCWMQDEDVPDICTGKQVKI